MAESAPKKRRITPQLLSASDIPPALPPGSHLSQPAFGEISLREQSRLSEQHLGPSRRIYIDLHGGGSQFSWRQVLKARALTVPNSETSAPGRPSSSSEPGPSSQAASNPAQGQAASWLDQIVGRIEGRYAHRDGGAAEEEDIEEDSRPSSETTEGDAKGDLYSYDDGFIDDEEEAERIEQEHRRPKQQGFFIDNGGRDGAVVEQQKPDMPEEPPVRRKRKMKAHKISTPARPEDDAPRSRQPAVPAPASAAERSTQPVSAPASAPSAPAFAGTGMAAMCAAAGWKAATSPPPKQPAQSWAEPSSPPGTPADRAAAAQEPEGASTNPSSPRMKQPAPAETPGKRRAAVSPAKPFPPELQAGLDKLRTHVASLPRITEGDKRQLPRTVDTQLDNMSCTIRRHSLPLGGYIAAPLMEFLGEYTNSKNLVHRLRTGADNVKRGLDAASTALQRAIQSSLLASDTASGSQRFTWDAEIDKLVTDYARKWVKLNGGSVQGSNSGQLYKHMVALWPAGAANGQQLRQAFKRGAAPGASGAVKAAAPAGQALAPPAAPPRQEQPASAAPAEPAQLQPGGSLPAPVSPSAPAAVAKTFAQPLWPLPTTAAAPAMPSKLDAVPGNATGQQGSVPERRTLTLAEIKELALSKGADRATVEDSISHFNNGKAPLRAILNQVLLLAEGRGLKVAQIIEAANKSGLSGGTGWAEDRSKKGNITGTMISCSRFLPAVTRGTYAHAAFPGVQEAATRHLALQKAAAEEKKAAHPPAAAAPSRAGNGDMAVSGALGSGPSTGGASTAMVIGQSLLGQPMQAAPTTV